MTAPTGLPLSVLATEIRERRLSPVELVEACLRRIDHEDERLGAFITLCRDEALAEAREAESRIAAGGHLGPLHGVPITLKDLFETRGVRTTAGSRILADWVPDRDAAVVERLRAAGAIVLGKVHTTEFALWATGGHPLYRVPRNPWNPERIPGGSSGGSSVSVAAGFCAASIGTDTGGSARIPASFTGLVGLKPTYGLISTHGVIPTSWTHDHVGIIARTVADATHLLRALAAVDPRDPGSIEGPVPDVSEVARTDLRGVRVGVHREVFEDVDDDVLEAVDGTLVALADAGAAMTDVGLPSLPRFAPVSFIIQLTEMLAYHSRTLRTRIDEYGADVRRGLAMGQFVLGVQYVQAQRAAKVLQAEMRRLFEQVDVLVGPTVPVVAPRMGEQTLTVAGRTLDLNSVIGQRTRLFNVTGCPAVTVPCGFSRDGLPVGLQVAGRHLDERTVLRVAHAVERTGFGQGASPPWL